MSRKATGKRCAWPGCAEHVARRARKWCVEHQVASLKHQQAERLRQWRRSSKSPSSPGGIRGVREAPPDSKQTFLAWMLGKVLL